MECRPNVVVVEEPGLPRNVLVKALLAWGYPCVVADSEKSAWGAVQGVQRPVVVVIDWLAEFLDCEEFIERISSSPDMEGVYVLAGISRGAVGGLRQCVMAGADDCVSRPYDLDEMRLRLHQAARLMGLAPADPVFPEE